MEIRKVHSFDRELVRKFLEKHVETSLFLLSNLDAHGVELGDALNSGNYKIVEDGGKVVAVFCLTRRGNLLLQTGGRTDIAGPIFEACADEPIRIQGVIGEWDAAESVWCILSAQPGFRIVLESRERLYRHELDPNSSPVRADVKIVVLEAAHAPQWEALNRAYLDEERLPDEEPRDTRIQRFAANAHERRWWGALQGDEIVSIAGLNAIYRQVGQVGGVHTRPELRGRGLSTAVMRRLLTDCRAEHGLTTMILFTGEDNVAARRVYERVGFQALGEFALLFGAWLEAG